MRGNYFFLRLAGIIFFHLLVISGLGIPAAVAQVPPAVDPGQVEKRFVPSLVPPKSPRLGIPTPTSPELSPAQRAQLEQKRFVLKEVRIEGATVYTSEQLAFTYESMLGKTVSLADAQTIAKNITDLYHRDGYLLSQAVVPPQEIATGALNIRVVEGYVSNIIIEGELKENSWRKVVESYADHIKEKRPVRTQDLERYLLLINDLPGAAVSGLLKPSPDQFGGADLVLTMKHKMFDGSYTLDNRGSKFIGPLQHSVAFAANSLLGMYERTQVRLITTSPTTELRFIELQHDEIVSSEGTKLTLLASHTRTEPGDALTPLQIVGESDLLEAKLTHPFIRSRQENLIGRAVLDIRETDTNVFNDVDFTNDRLRVVRLGGNYNFSDGWRGSNLFDAQVSQGLDVFSATDGGSDSSNPLADSDFTKINFDISRLQSLPSNFSLLLTASGQYAFDPLVVPEQFSLGGVGFGQAYDPAELLGDHGLAGKVELRYGQTLDKPYLSNYQFYGYYDIGAVWLRGLAPGVEDKQSLASAGAGVRVTFTDYLAGSVEVGVPLTRPASNQDNGSNPRLFFGVVGRF